ncbi:MAG: hypothetical protein WEE89_09720 [Gemmatimonadota bacterium]
MRTALVAVGCLLCVTVLSAQTPRWTATRDLRIGDVNDPEYAISYVRSLLVGRDGSIYALQDQSEVRVFGAEGRSRFKFGRRGEGPGEFTGAARMGWKGDTIWIYDSRQARISLFLPDGKFLSVLPARNPSVPAGAGVVRATGLLADGTLIGGLAVSANDAAEGRVTSNALLRFSRQGEGEGARAVLDTLAVYSIRNSTHLITDPENPRGVRSYTSQPFGDAPLVATAADGGGVYVVDRPIATNARQANFTVSRMNLRGDTVYRRSFVYVPQRLAKTQVDSVVRERVATSTKSVAAGFAPALQPGNAERLVRKGLFVPVLHPPVQQVVSGDDGTLWLRREDLGRATHTWQVLDANGVTIATVDLRGKLAVTNARRTAVWGQEFDELQVSYIVRYRLTAGPPPRR